MIVVYTAAFGNYDTLRNVPTIPGVRFVAFTDQEVSSWECLQPPVTESTSQRENRKYKSCPHLLFPSADWTIYHDANIDLTSDPRDIVRECRDGINLFSHNLRDCAYDEAEEIRRRVDGAILDDQLTRYRQAGFPADYGLFWGGLLIRSKTANRLNEFWWREIQAGVVRDQVSLPFSIWRTNASCHILPGDIPFHGGANRLCTRRPHKVN